MATQNQMNIVIEAMRRIAERYHVAFYFTPTMYDDIAKTILTALEEHDALERHIQQQKGKST